MKNQTHNRGFISKQVLGSGVKYWDKPGCHGSERPQYCAVGTSMFHGIWLYFPRNRSVRSLYFPFQCVPIFTLDPSTCALLCCLTHRGQIFGVRKTN